MKQLSVCSQFWNIRRTFQKVTFSEKRDSCTSCCNEMEKWQENCIKNYNCHELWHWEVLRSKLAQARLYDCFFVFMLLQNLQHAIQRSSNTAGPQNFLFLWCYTSVCSHVSAYIQVDEQRGRITSLISQEMRARMSVDVLRVRTRYYCVGEARLV